MRYSKVENWNQITGPIRVKSGGENGNYWPGLSVHGERDFPN